MARELAPNADALAALRFIREFCLCADHIAYRYTVKQIDEMCAQLGLQPVDRETEVEKVSRLLDALKCDT